MEAYLKYFHSAYDSNQHKTAKAQLPLFREYRFQYYKKLC